MSTLERAIALSAAVHAGQRDKAGAPYVLHVLRVMHRQTDDVRRIVAVLHDVVEDTPVTLPQLAELGFAPPVLAAVDALTKRPAEEDDYFAFVERAGRDPVAWPVKLADIEDNQDATRLANPTPRDHARLVRYARARRLVHVLAREHGAREALGRPLPPTILPLAAHVTPEQLEAECPGARPILACDFHVAGAEGWAMGPGGPRAGRIVNVDHHAPLPAMARPVTSTALALEYLAAAPDGPAPWVVVNHTDCDSVLASALLLGHLPDDPALHATLTAAAECADHTGAPHPVADLLQALDEEREGDRTEAQYLASLHHLQRPLAGELPEPDAARALAARAARRATAAQLVANGALRPVESGPAQNAVHLAVLDAEVDGAFLPALVPEAVLIALASPHPDHPDRWTVKLRLGPSAPPGLTLAALNVARWDPAFGGRWNAGSNKRGGGTALAPIDYAARLGAALHTALDAQRPA